MTDRITSADAVQTATDGATAMLDVAEVDNTRYCIVATRDGARYTMATLARGDSRTDAERLLTVYREIPDTQSTYAIETIIDDPTPSTSADTPIYADDLAALDVLPQLTAYPFGADARAAIARVAVKLGYGHAASVAARAVQSAEDRRKAYAVITARDVDNAISQLCIYSMYETARAVPHIPYAEVRGACDRQTATARDGSFYVCYFRTSGTCFHVRYRSLDALRGELDAIQDTTRRGHGATLANIRSWQFANLG